MVNARNVILGKGSSACEGTGVREPSSFRGRRKLSIGRAERSVRLEGEPDTEKGSGTARGATVKAETGKQHVGKTCIKIIDYLRRRRRQKGSRGPEGRGPSQDTVAESRRG